MKPISQEIQEALLRSKAIFDGIIEDFPTGEFPHELRNTLFCALCDIVMEHHGSIIVLVERGQYDASALALLRPLLETSVRAFWVWLCSDEQELTAIVRGDRKFPGLSDCLAAVQQHFSSQGFPGAVDIAKSFVGQLHGLTHTGIEAIQFRMSFSSKLEIKPSYPDRTLSELLQQSDMYATKTAIARINFMEARQDYIPVRAENVINRYMRLYGNEQP